MSLKKEKASDLVLLQISDLHIFANDDESFDEVDTKQSLADVIALLQQNDPEYDLIVASGDLVQHANEKAYERVVEGLATLTGPIFTLPGNHDDPSMMARAFMDTPLQFATHSDHAHWRIIYLDSWKPESHGGRLDNTDLRVLETALSESTEKHALICLHHHPVSINSPWMDSMMLENPEAFFEIVDQFQHVRGIIWGHIHQHFESIRNNVRLLGTPSTCAQFEPGAREFTLDALQPGYRYLSLKENGEIETRIERLPV